MKTASRFLVAVPAVLLLVTGEGATTGPEGFALDSEGGSGPIRAEWTGPVAVSRERDGGRSVLVLERTRHGSFAEAVLESSPGWAEAGVLETVVEVATYGIVSAKLMEPEAEGLEGWTVSANLVPGVHTLRWRLKPDPDGDLRPASPAGDGLWNPGGTGIRRLRIGFSGGRMTVRSIRLLAAER